jgi:hypothetical protein
VELEAQRIRERAVKLREMAQAASPPSITSQLLEVAEELDRRAAQLELLAKQMQPN